MTNTDKKILQLYHIPAGLIILPMLTFWLLHIDLLNYLFIYVPLVIVSVSLWFYSVIKCIHHLVGIPPNQLKWLFRLLIAHTVLGILRFWVAGFFELDGYQPFVLGLSVLGVLVYLVFLIKLIPQINRVIIGRQQWALVLELLLVFTAIVNLSPMFLSDLSEESSEK